jgi:hypothetical protein
MLSFQPAVPVNVALLRKRVFAGRVELRGGHSELGWVFLVFFFLSEIGIEPRAPHMLGK